MATKGPNSRSEGSMLELVQAGWFKLARLYEGHLT